MNPERLDYCQFLLSSQGNSTLTHYADHHEHFSHDALNRYLRGERITSRSLWENLRDRVQTHEDGILIFDDTVLDKHHAHKIEMVHRQCSGNAHGVLRGIGMINCVYVNPHSGLYWIIDYRLFDPDHDGRTRIDHVREMLGSARLHKDLPVRTLLMDTWYATNELMLHAASRGLIYYCPIKSNRLVDDSLGLRPYKRVDALEWSPHESRAGKMIRIRKFPGISQVKLFRVQVSGHRTDWIVTNDFSQDSMEAAHDKCRIRWQIEQFHREFRQLTEGGEMPMPQGISAAQSYCLCGAGL